MREDITVIFDFDGTVADSLKLLWGIYNKLALEYGCRNIKEEEIETLRGFSARELIAKLKIPLLKLPFMVEGVREELARNIEFVDPIPGMQKVLKRLQKSYNLMILTSNSEENVHAFLSVNKMEFFDCVYSGSTIFGKQRLINYLIKDFKLDKSKVIYVGDEVRDIEAAKKSGIKVVSVSWGLNTKELLAKHNPDFLITSPQELVSVLDKLRNFS